MSIGVHRWFTTIPGMKVRIDNACWLGEEGWFHRGTIQLADGRIAGLDSHFATDDPAKGPAAARLRWPAGARRLDAAGLFIVPGLIDAHVHLREPGQAVKEGIANGTAAALKGGVTTLLDMPNNAPPVTTRALFEAKQDLFVRKSRVNYGLFLQATASGPRAPKSAAGVKIYMARSSELGAVRDVETLARIFRREGLAVVHAEDEKKFFTAKSKSDRDTNPRAGGALVHHLRRPKTAIKAALRSLEQAWRKVPAKLRPRLVIAHVGTAEEVEWVARMKRLGHDVWAETCPHYFLFTEQDYLAQGSHLQVNPPLRGEKDRLAVWEAVRNSGIDFISTDHAPHLPAEKNSPSPPSGIAGIEWLGPLLLTLARRGDLSWKRYLELAGGNAAACYGIEGRGILREGAWADLAFAEAVRKTHGGHGKIVTRAAWNPYAAFEFSTRIRAVMVNGKLARVDGRLRPGVRGLEV